MASLKRTIRSRCLMALWKWGTPGGVKYVIQLSRIQDGIWRVPEEVGGDKVRGRGPVARINTNDAAWDVSRDRIVRKMLSNSKWRGEGQKQGVKGYHTWKLRVRRWMLFHLEILRWLACWRRRQLWNPWQRLSWGPRRNKAGALGNTKTEMCGERLWSLMSMKWADKRTPKRASTGRTAKEDGGMSSGKSTSLTGAQPMFECQDALQIFFRTPVSSKKWDAKEWLAWKLSMISARL